MAVVVALFGCEGGPGVGTRAGNCSRLISFVDDMSDGSLSNAEIGDRLEAIQFPPDWGVLGDSYARLQEHFANGDEVSAADETFRLYDLCTDYLANRQGPVMGMFSQTRGVMKMQKRWRQMWDGPNAACTPRPGMDPDRALHNLADLANAGGSATGDSLVVALEVVSGVDEYKSYPTAMEDLRHFYEKGDLLTTSGHPLRQFASWGAVVELAEAACLLARPVKVQGWVNEHTAAAGRGEPHELPRCLELAPLTTLDTYRFWKGVREQSTPDDEDYEEKVAWADEALAQFRSAGVSGFPSS